MGYGLSRDEICRTERRLQGPRRRRECGCLIGGFGRCVVALCQGDDCMQRRGNLLCPSRAHTHARTYGGVLGAVTNSDGRCKHAFRRTAVPGRTSASARVQQLYASSAASLCHGVRLNAPDVYWLALVPTGARLRFVTLGCVLRVGAPRGNFRRALRTNGLGRLPFCLGGPPWVASTRDQEGPRDM
ncbi:hypothetical protein MRX96_057094 [Rhipicephalus microplus]